MGLKIRKLVVSFSALFIVSLIVAVLFRGSIFASDVILTNNNSSSTSIDNLSFPGQFTFTPIETGDLKMGNEIPISKAYHIYDGEKIFGEILLSDNGSFNTRKASGLMISRISRNYSLITRDRYENGSGENKIIYREWGTAKKDNKKLNYQNLIIKDNNLTWYIILYYNDPFKGDVDHMIRSVNFIS